MLFDNALPVDLPGFFQWIEKRRRYRLGHANFVVGFHAANRKAHLLFFFFFSVIGENQCGRITRNTEKNLHGLTCDGKKIPLVSNTRLLGEIVDSNLSWKDHVDRVCLKVNRKIGSLRRSFRQLTPTARRAFFSR